MDDNSAKLPEIECAQTQRMALPRMSHFGEIARSGLSHQSSALAAATALNMHAVTTAANTQADAVPLLTSTFCTPYPSGGMRIHHIPCQAEGTACSLHSSPSSLRTQINQEHVNLQHSKHSGRSDAIMLSDRTKVNKHTRET